MTSNPQHARSLCFTHAQDLIDAASRLLKDKTHPHIAHHLALLALEEVGKAAIIGARFASSDRPGAEAMEKWLGSHQRKIQWAVWSPMRRIDPADFEEARKFAENAHRRRLQSLYVDPSAELADLSPREHVTEAQATTILNLARARLDLEMAGGEQSSEPSEILDWFFETIDDPEGSKRLFSRPFLAKYEELEGDAQAWAAWAKEEFARLSEESEQVMRTELARVGSPVQSAVPRWRTRMTLYSPSHSLRSKTLAFWNEKIEAVKLVWTGKKDQCLLEVTLNDSTLIADVYGGATSLSQLVIACLNIGSIGYFWPEQPGFLRERFSDVRDLENPKMSLRIQTAASFWGNGRAVALEDRHLQHAIECMMAFGRLSDEDAAPIFRPYLDGLALVAKSDILLSFDHMAQAAFRASLAAALARYGGWNGETDQFEIQFHLAFEPFMPEREHRDQVLQSLTAESKGRQEQFDALRTSKQLIDLYFIHIARDEWSQTLKAMRKRPPE